MTRKTNIYKKNYSTIANIQSEEHIYYDLLETYSFNFTFFGIEIVQKNSSNDVLNKIYFEGISEQKGFVLDIIKFLYENSIKPDSALAVISDLISSQEYLLD